MLEMLISGQKGPSGFHTAGSDPNIIDWDFGSLSCQS
jgi:hypothetical protein